MLIFLTMPHQNGAAESVTTALETLVLSERGYRRKKFKIGLDYGTTFSAGAYCLISGSNRHLQCDRIYAFTGFTGEFTESKRQETELPSDIRYESTIIKIGFDAINSDREWPDKGHLIRRAKLGLDDRPETARARETLNHDLAELPGSKGAIQVIADYLTVLFTRFKEQLLDVGYDDRDSIELNCAAPSIWTLTARRNLCDAIEEAARESGLAFEDIRLWPEAEAATEHAVKQHPNLNIQVCSAIWHYIFYRQLTYLT